MCIYKAVVTVGTYPATLLWETFTASAAVSSSAGAAVLLPTLSDTNIRDG